MKDEKFVSQLKTKNDRLRIDVFEKAVFGHTTLIFRGIADEKLVTGIVINANDCEQKELDNVQVWAVAPVAEFEIPFMHAFFQYMKQRGGTKTITFKSFEDRSTAWAFKVGFDQMDNKSFIKHL